MRNFLFFFLFLNQCDMMYGEIDLETYTHSIIKLNTAFEKLESDEPISEIKRLFKESFTDLNKLYNDIIDDLNQDEINLNEYYLFFQNGKRIFPQYIEALGKINNHDLDECISHLMNLFNNLNKIADAFPKNEMMK